ncbi:hypothetical protein FKG96_12555 [Olivibacter sp. LS-1]|uniref:hypothetical protein n=1 Tax=Olivibacter sp. LS-1 TaxID=2592345 RepID=UPI0011EB19EE|nr:hypothetical protein [Olivibacter sp. LS-1]QEL01603.1 hypothetical protein FKG96_12555 [Olivibacter sp. LS-1]
MDINFKVGDKVKHRKSQTEITITNIESESIIVGEFIDQYGAIVVGRFYTDSLGPTKLPTAEIIDV